MKRKAYLVHSGHGSSWEFCGVFPDPNEAAVLAGRQIDGHVEPRAVTRRELENLKEDDVSDAEWASYGGAN